MKNTDIFNPSEGYDMVVAITQKTINDQFIHLSRLDPPVIKTSIIMGLVRNPKKPKTYLPKFYNSFADVPKDSTGTPLTPVIQANYMPRVEVNESGTTIVLVLGFKNGKAWFFDPIGGVMEENDVTGWKFGIPVSLDFAGISRADMAASKVVPQIVKDRMNSFTSDDFSISQLFVDFTSTDLARFDPSTTTVGEAGDDTQHSFVYFMTKFLEVLTADPKANPYILGYSITPPPPSTDQDSAVNPALKPIGQTFTVYKDPVNPDLNNINFILNTEGGQGGKTAGIHPTPGVFDSNWITPNEQCDGKMIFSSYCLLESLVLKPFYETYSSLSFETLGKASISVAPPPTYENARSFTSTGISYNVANTTGDISDQYVNNFLVNFKKTSPTGITLTIKGHMWAQKSQSIDVGICTASAWGNCTTDWTSIIAVDVSKDAMGRPTLSVQSTRTQIDDSFTDHGSNTCAKAVGWLLDIINNFISIFTGSINEDFLESIFKHMLLTDVGPSVGRSTHNSFMLPAGQVFFFKDMDIDTLGNISLEVTYKTNTFAHNKPISPKPYLPKPRKEIQAEPILPNPLATPIFDRISVTALDKDKSPLDITVSCELMSNSQQAMPISPSREVEVIQDISGQALIFSIGSDKQLNMLASTSGTSGSGWTATNLVSSFAGYSAAIAFDVSQDATGLISVAFALTGKAGIGTDVFFASMLSNDLTKTDFTKLSAIATKVEGIDPNFETKTILLGTSDDTQRPLLIIQGRLDDSRHFYQLQADSQTPRQMELPENTDNGLLGLCMGYNFGQRANYFLYKTGLTKSLVAITIADSNLGSLTYDYSPGSNQLPPSFQQLDYNTIATATSRSGPDSTNSDLYIGAKTGVYRIPHGQAQRMEMITENITDVHEISVVYDLTNVSLWVSASPSYLYYIPGQRGNDGKSINWSVPTLFARNALHIAPMRSIKNGANEIFTVNTDLSITHYWQDPNSTFWRNKTEKVKEDPYVLNFDSYTSHIHIENTKGVPSYGTKVKITASEWIYCTINGLVYSVDEDTPAEVEADIQGNITIITAAIDISPAILHVQSDSFAETLNIYTNGKVHYHLRAITDGAALKTAKTQDGKPVLASDTSSDVADGVAYNLSRLTTTATQEFPPSLSGNKFVAVESPPKHRTATAIRVSSQTPKHSWNRALKHRQCNFATGMTVRNGGWVLHNEAQAINHIRSNRLGSIWDDVSNIAGDFWHWAENFFDKAVMVIENGILKLKDGVTFVLRVVGEGLEFVLDLGDKVFRLVLKTVGMVFKAINWILKLVGIDLGKILAWLGHLLGFDNVWKTHKMISGTTKGFLDYGIENSTHYIEILREISKTFFNSLDNGIKKAILPVNPKSTGPSIIKSGPADNDSSTASLNAPQSNFAFYHLVHSSGAAANTSDPATKSTASVENSHDPFTQFYNDVLDPVYKVIIKKFGKDADDLIKLVTETSLDNFRILLADIADTLISVLAQIMDGLLKFTEDILKDLQDIIEEPMEIPIIGALWEFVTTLFGEDEPFTVLNASSFLVALVATPMCKIATGYTPDELNNNFDNPGFASSAADLVNAALKQPPLKAHPKKVTKTDSSVSPDAYKALKQFSYAEGMISPLSSIGINLCNVFSSGLVRGDPELDIFRKLLIYLSVLKAVFCWPVPIPGEEPKNYTARWVGWAMSTISQVIGLNMPDANIERLMRLRTIVDTLVLVIAIIIDVDEHAGILPWLSDMLGNIGGIVARATPSPDVRAVGSAVAIFGGVFGFANGCATLSKDTTAFRLFNVGG